MKRLFMLRDKHNRPFMGIPKANGPLCFSSKPEAKARRDEIRETFQDENKVVPFEYDLHVSPAFDHHNFKGV